MNYYLTRRASPWVSASVLVGGLTAALLLFSLARFERSLEIVEAYTEIGEVVHHH